MVLRDLKRCPETSQRKIDFPVPDTESLPFLPLSSSERKSLKKLHTIKGRDEAGLCLVEGLKPVLELTRSDSWSAKAVLVSETLLSDASPCLSDILASEYFNARIVRNGDIAACGTLKTPEGIIALAAVPENKGAGNQAIDFPAIYLHEINDPGNLGTIIRTAAWFGVTKLMLSPGAVDPFHPKVIRASMGSVFHVDCFKNVDFDTVADYCADNQIRIIGTHMKGDPLDKSGQGAKWVLVFGSEAHGLPAGILEKCTDITGIPKRGRGESLNLGVSVGILLNQFVS